jgi:hypothetical protein
LTVHGALAGGDESAPIREELNRRRWQVEAVIRDRLKRARDENDLSASVDPSDLARYVATVIQGMAVQASADANRVALQRVVKIALRGWPV